MKQLAILQPKMSNETCKKPSIRKCQNIKHTLSLTTSASCQTNNSSIYTGFENLVVPKIKPSNLSCDKSCDLYICSAPTLLESHWLSHRVQTQRPKCTSAESILCHELLSHYNLMAELMTQIFSPSSFTTKTAKTMTTDQKILWNSKDV